MFFLSIPFALELIAVAFGGLLLIKACKHSHTFAKFLAYLVILLGLIGLICTGYYATKSWFTGNYGCPHKMMMMKKDGHPGPKMEKLLPGKPSQKSPH